MSKRLAKRVMLIGWDAADWQMINPLLEAGQMPNLQKLIDRGVMGNVATLNPIISPILWNSIATGKLADKHDILSFVEPNGKGGIRPVSSTSRRAKAVWNILSQNGLRSCVVGWYASHPAEPINGVIVTDRYQRSLHADDEATAYDQNTIHPRDMRETFDALRVRIDQITSNQVLPFVPNADRVDQKSDTRLADIAQLLSGCATVHNATTYLVENEEWDFLAVYYDAIDHFGHGFMPYHPPRMPEVSESDFDIYSSVMAGCYRFHDMLLGRLVALAGPETTIILLSDHGFFSDEMRPTRIATLADGTQKRIVDTSPLAWHRPYGVLVMSGPGIKEDTLVYGASLLDITPTILALLGQPVAADMDGRALTQSFAESVTLDRIPSYEDEHPDDGVHRGEQFDDPYSAQTILKSLIELGYIEAPGDDQTKAVEQNLRDRQHNLAQVYFSTGRMQQAYDILIKLLKDHDAPQFRSRIAMCLIAMGRIDEAEEILRDVVTNAVDRPLATLLYGQVLLARREFGEARRRLEEVQRLNPRLPHLHVMLGRVYLNQAEYGLAETAYRKALEIDGDNAEAHDGLGDALFHQERLEDALFEYMTSASLLHHRPTTHIHLGVVLTRLRRFDWAIQAFTVATELAPRLPFPHRCLALLYARHKKDYETAKFHMETALRLRAALREDAGREAAAT